MQTVDRGLDSPIETAFVFKRGFGMEFVADNCVLLGLYRGNAKETNNTGIYSTAEQLKG